MVEADRTETAFAPAADYEHRLSCQIWSVEGGLLGQSEGAPDGQLSSSSSGFSTSEVDGQIWRVS